MSRWRSTKNFKPQILSRSQHHHAKCQPKIRARYRPKPHWHPSFPRAGSGCCGRTGAHRGPRPPHPTQRNWAGRTARRRRPPHAKPLHVTQDVARALSIGMISAQNPLPLREHIPEKVQCILPHIKFQVVGGNCKARPKGVGMVRA